MSVWATISKALGTQPPKPKEGAVYLYCRPSRPFHWVSEDDTGDRPCVKVTGVTLQEASKAFAGKSIKWDTIDYLLMAALTDSGQAVTMTIDQLKPKEDAQ